MQTLPLPLIPFLISSLIPVTANTGGGGFDAWSLLERYGIAAVMGFIAWRLWLRSEAQRNTSETERLTIQKALLDSHEKNAANLQAIIVANMEERNELKIVLTQLTDTLESRPCQPKQ